MIRYAIEIGDKLQRAPDDLNTTGWKHRCNVMNIPVDSLLTVVEVTEDCVMFEELPGLWYMMYHFRIPEESLTLYGVEVTAPLKLYSTRSSGKTTTIPRFIFTSTQMAEAAFPLLKETILRMSKEDEEAHGTSDQTIDETDGTWSFNVIPFIFKRNN